MKALAKRYYTQSAYSRINISYKVPSDTQAKYISSAHFHLAEFHEPTFGLTTNNISCKKISSATCWSGSRSLQSPCSLRPGINFTIRLADSIVGVRGGERQRSRGAPVPYKLWATYWHHGQIASKIDLYVSQLDSDRDCIDQLSRLLLRQQHEAEKSFKCVLNGTVAVVSCFIVHEYTQTYAVRFHWNTRADKQRFLLNNVYKLSCKHTV